MVKKGLLGAALGAGALFLVFGTSAPHYVKTAFHKFRQSAKDAIPPQFEIDRAREEIAGLKPQIEKNIELLARAEVEAEHLDKEIQTIQVNLEGEKHTILGLRDRLKKGEYRLTGRVTETADEAKCELACRYDHFKNVTQLLTEKRAELKAKRKTIDAAHSQLKNLRDQKSILLTKLANIEASLRLIEATQARNEFSLDDTALAHAKQTVSELEERLEVLARKAEMEGRYSRDLGTPSGYVEPGRDVVKEVDEAFGPSSGHASKTAEKSL
jgi:chromosome segregation ATPase